MVLVNGFSSHLLIDMRTFFLIILSAHFLLPAMAQAPKFKNNWEAAPVHIPNRVSTDAPLLGNGDIGTAIGFEKNTLRYYLTKNDFWRLQSKAEGRSGPRVAGFFDVIVKGNEELGFRASQSLFNGETTCTLSGPRGVLQARTWISATDNLIITELTAMDKPVNLEIRLSAPENRLARLALGHAGEAFYMTRSFRDSVDIPTEISVAFKAIGHSGDTFTLKAGEKLTLALAFESKFKKKAPQAYVSQRVKQLDQPHISALWKKHNAWWDSYWKKSSIRIADTVLMKAYYQGLYTMGACARDKIFPPGIFGWVTTDQPNWNGDYHLNYNFFAPFYALYGANRLEQASVQEQPLLDFMPKGKHYARLATKTRGLLYPVGIGPLGVDLTRDFPVNTDNYTLPRDVEFGGLFYMQRSNAVFGTVGMAQYWRSTYDPAYAKKIYPYVLAVIEFWEDYLKLENGRYVIYNDAETEKSGYNTNPTMSLALLRNALDLVIDLSSALKRDLPRQAKWKDIFLKLSAYPVSGKGDQRFFAGSEANDQGRKNVGGNFSLIYPANAVTLSSSDGLQAIAWHTISRIQRWQHENSTNSFYAAAIRVGYDPGVVYNELHKYALHTYPNGFQLDNPHGVENAGTVANVLQEMCCMSVDHEIRLFSSWPEKLDASFQNIRAWDAFLVSARLSNGKVSGVKIRSERGRFCTLINPWREGSVELLRNGKKAGVLSGARLQFKTSVNELIEIRPLVD
jgi:alpha-L-fucosidase 2